MRKRWEEAVTNLLTEVERFRAWADANFPAAERFGEWECDYEHWPAIYVAAADFFAAQPFSSWSDDELRAVLYILARDNEIGEIAGCLRYRNLELLGPVTHAALALGERDARWQLAEQLGRLGVSGGDAKELLVVLARDEDEYVRRRALRSSARTRHRGARARSVAPYGRGSRVFTDDGPGVPSRDRIGVLRAASG
jgi:hypothetical protein